MYNSDIVIVTSKTHFVPPVFVSGYTVESQKLLSCEISTGIAKMPDLTTNATTVSDTIVPAGQSWQGVLEVGQFLKITDLEGKQGVDFLCYNADNRKERYHAPNTIKAAQNIRIEKDTVLYSDFANPMMTVIEDSLGGHDTIAGCCSIPSNKMLYGAKSTNGCRENFLHSLEAHGMGWTDIVPNINFFCSVPVHGDGSTEAGVFAQSPSRPGEYVKLQAEMRILALISNCPQVNNPCNDGNPTEIRVEVLKP